MVERSSLCSAVLRQYAIAENANLTALGNHGGFSGARLWRLIGPHADHCLRAWPIGVDAVQLAETHRLMSLAHAAGLDFVPRLERTCDGGSLVSFADHYWELTTWLPGVADFHGRPAPARLARAVAALALIHDAWQDSASAGPCPAVMRRLQRAARWQTLVDSGWQPRFADDRLAAMNLWAKRAWPIVRRRVRALAARLQPWLATSVPVQPCLCDIWHDHVLYSGDAVTGIVDYGSVRLDHVAVDLARLIGSMAGNDERLRGTALAAYQESRTLTRADLALMELLDDTGTVLGAANWLMWVYHDGRSFADMDRAATRLAALVQRLE